MSALDDTARLRQVSDVVACTLDGGNALLDLSSSNYYTLNGSAAMIWEWIGSGATVPELVERMLETFDVDRETCVTDVEAVVASFREARLVVEVD
jgi:hypothetical protein